MIDGWPSEIVAAVAVRRRLAELDHLYPYPLPEDGASEERLVATEAVVGALDPRYRAFLRHADGWRGLLQNIDLFGTTQLRGDPAMQAALRGIAAVDGHDFETHVGFKLDQILSIGANSSSTDLWLLAKPDTSRAGQVLWFWGSDCEEFRNFDEFYLAMVDHNRLELQRLQQENGA